MTLTIQEKETLRKLSSKARLDEFENEMYNNLLRKMHDDDAHDSEDDPILPSYSSSEVSGDSDDSFVPSRLRERDNSGKVPCPYCKLPKSVSHQQVCCKRKIKCPYCRKKVSASYMKTHVQSFCAVTHPNKKKVIHKKKKPDQCPYCEKEFSILANHRCKLNPDRKPDNPYIAFMKAKAKEHNISYWDAKVQFTKEWNSKIPK